MNAKFKLRLYCPFKKGQFGTAPPLQTAKPHHDNPLGSLRSLSVAKLSIVGERESAIYNRSDNSNKFNAESRKVILRQDDSKSVERVGKLRLDHGHGDHSISFDLKE